MAFANKLLILLTIVCIPFSLPVSAQKKHNVFLSGTLYNFDNEIQLEDMTEMKYLNPPNPDWTFKTDDSKRFAISFYLERPGYFRLGRNIMYLMPGDRFDIFIDNDFIDTAIFRGAGKERNEYLKGTPFPHAGSFVVAGMELRPTVQQSIDAVLAAANKRRGQLKKVKNEYGDFKILEAARIEIDILNSLVMMETYGQLKFRKKPDSAELFKKDHEHIAKPLIEKYARKIGLNPLYLQLVVYQMVLPEIPGNRQSQPINDWNKASGYASNITYAKAKKDIYAYRDSLNYIKTKKYRDAVAKTMEMAIKFSNGDIAKDFVMRNPANENVSLSAFKGKVIYVDIWATWCGPCKEEMPYLDTLKEKYKHNNEVAFISLSIDDDTQKDRWLKFIKEKNYSANQFIINRIRLDPYSVTSVPRSIIIDKEFRVAMMYADAPSSPDIKKTIDKLLAGNR